MPKYAHDQRTGAGYGFTGRKGFQNPTPSGESFPYSDADTPYESDQSELDDDELNLKVLINNRLGYNNLGRQRGDQRADRSTLSKNVRLDLAESESPMGTLTGLVPFPMRRFDGPAMGGSSSNASFTVAPGRIDGSPYGWTRGVMSPLAPDQDAPSRFMDAIDPEVRDRIKNKLKITRLK
jgi:hypothetical protein